MPSPRSVSSACSPGSSPCSRCQVASWGREHGSASPVTLAERVTATCQEMARRRLFDPEFKIDLAYFTVLVEQVGFSTSVAAQPR